jgi:hypothetical protein
MRPGRAVIAVVVSAAALGAFGWNASHEVVSEETGAVQLAGAAPAYAGKYNPVELRGGSAEMRRTVQRMIIR